MDDFDFKIRQYLVEEGYLFPITDSEIEQALREVEEANVIIPPHLDHPEHFLVVRSGVPG